MQNDGNPRLFCFVGASKGAWRVTSISTIVGETLPKVSHVQIVQGAVQGSDSEGWILRGVTSNERYAQREEKDLLIAKQASLGRPHANLSALIPIRKNAKWWALTQDERRAIFEEQSTHITIGLRYLPEIARRLHHCRDLEETQPFDFLTLFDYSEDSESKFNDMIAELRETEEWKYVDREVDIRLVKVQ
jgi:chlorite dismutase